MNLLSSRALRRRDPGAEGRRPAGRCPRRLLDLAVVERLQRHLRLTSFSSSTWRSALSRSSVLRAQGDLVVAELDRGAGVLEVEPVGDLAAGLVDGVADLLQVDLGHDVEGRHGQTLSCVATRVGARAAKGSRL